MPANTREPNAAAGATRIHYERHRPEQSELYRLVQDHAASFFAQVEQATGVGLPKFVKEEFGAFLECGILAHGFLRLRCADCTHDKLVAFSCKRRGFCPSCGARRMAETAAHLVDQVIPNVPVRQWVLRRPGRPGYGCGSVLGTDPGRPSRRHRYLGPGFQQHRLHAADVRPLLAEYLG